MKKYSEVSKWDGDFLNYFEFLIMKEFEKIHLKKPNTETKCKICDQSLYPINDPDFSTKILTQVQSVSDSDVICLNGCLHPVHINCFKSRVTPDFTYKCSCNTEYGKHFFQKS